MNWEQWPNRPSHVPSIDVTRGLEPPARSPTPAPKPKGEPREPEQDRQQRKHHSRIPKPLFSLVGLPPSDDSLEIRQPPCLFYERRLHRGIQIHQFKVKDHVEFLVSRKDVRRKRRGVVCKGRLAYRDQVVVCGNHSAHGVERTA